MNLFPETTHSSSSGSSQSIPVQDNQNQTLGCPSTIQRVPAKSLILLAKLAEGILVGGYVLVIIFSICGNIAALIIVVKSRAPKLSTKYFLICLVLSDLILTAFAPPISIGNMMSEYNTWIFGALMCKIVPLLQMIAATMNAMCLMAIAVERNLLIVQTMSSRATSIQRLWQKWICPGISASIVVIPVICGLPNIWMYDFDSFTVIPSDTSGNSESDSGFMSTATTTNPPDTTTMVTAVADFTSTAVPPPCKIYHYCLRTQFDRRNISYWSVTGSTYFLLLICFIFCYVSIYRFVQEHGEYWKQMRVRQYSISSGTGHSIHNTTPSSNPNDAKLMAGERHRKTLKLILCLIILHLFCRLPNWLYIVVVNVKYVENTVAIATLRECLHFLSAIHSALNPFLYVIWNHSLRATADRRGMPGARRDNGRRHRSCCWRTRKCCHRKFNHMIHSIGSCCRYKQESIDGHGQNVEPIGHSSHGWLVRAPRIYHISGSGGITTTNNPPNDHNHNNMAQSNSTQPVYISYDKSHL